MDSVRRQSGSSCCISNKWFEAKSEMLHFVLFFSFCHRRLYFKSLSSGETEKEKYFLVLQVSIYFSIFLYVNGGFLAHLSFV